MGNERLLPIVALNSSDHGDDLFVTSIRSQKFKAFSSGQEYGGRTCVGEAGPSAGMYVMGSRVAKARDTSTYEQSM